MRFHNEFDDILGNRIRLRLLRILARTGGQGLTGRELARMCGASSSQTIASLQRLEDSGLILRDIAGRAHIWRFADGHALGPVLTSLFRAEAESLTTLKKDIESVIRNLPVHRAVLFGSVARGDERPTSDVDLLVVVRSRADKGRVEEALGAASIDFATKFGNPLSSLVIEERQLRSPPNPSLLTNIRHDGVELETSA
ncbi:MAG: nucleotidyltransferase domain-containing protein [Thermoplasmata archaeon]